MSACRLEDLPNETLHSIFLLVAYDDPGTLPSLCVASRVFRPVAQPLLLFHIRPRLPFAFDAGVRFFLRHPELRSSVRHLTLEGGVSNPVSDEGRFIGYHHNPKHEDSHWFLGLTESEKGQLADAVPETLPPIGGLSRWKEYLREGLVGPVYALLLVWFDRLETFEWRVPERNNYQQLFILRLVEAVKQATPGNFPSPRLPLRILRHVHLKRWIDVDMIHPNVARPFLGLPGLKTFRADRAYAREDGSDDDEISSDFDLLTGWVISLFAGFPDRSSSIEDLVLVDAKADVEGLVSYARTARYLRRLSCHAHAWFGGTLQDGSSEFYLCVEENAATLEELELDLTMDFDNADIIRGALRYSLRLCTKLRKLQVPIHLLEPDPYDIDSDSGGEGQDDNADCLELLHVLPSTLEHLRVTEASFPQVRAILAESGRLGRLSRLKSLQNSTFDSDEDWAALQTLAIQADVQLIVLDFETSEVILRPEYLSVTTMRHLMAHRH